jgi:lysophospholipid acyltransferase (LPLAT)-like uncharacterized protein
MAAPLEIAASVACGFGEWRTAAANVMSNATRSARVRIFSSKRLASTPWVQKTVGVVAAEYLRMVWNTSRFELEPPDIYETVLQEMPVILAMWHGQHFLMPFIKHKGEKFRAKVLISRHRDGEINAIAAEWLGIGTIRGSGDHGSEFNRKGGVSAFREMLTALEQGYNIALTADVPKVARVAGLGIIKLAQMSGRPIYPVAIATRRRIEFNSWDRSALNLPFGRGARIVGPRVRVPYDADEAALVAAQRELERALNTATERAYEISDATRGGKAGG